MNMSTIVTTPGGIQGACHCRDGLQLPPPLTHAVRYRTHSRSTGTGCIRVRAYAKCCAQRNCRCGGVIENGAALLAAGDGKRAKALGG